MSPESDLAPAIHELLQRCFLRLRELDKPYGHAILDRRLAGVAAIESLHVAANDLDLCLESRGVRRHDLEDVAALALSVEGISRSAPESETSTSGTSILPCSSPAMGTRGCSRRSFPCHATDMRNALPAWKTLLRFLCL